MREPIGVPPGQTAPPPAAPPPAGGRARLGAVAEASWLPTALFALGLLLRLAVWWRDRGYEPVGDEQYYYQAAVLFAQTGAYVDPPTPAWLPVHRVPLLPLLAGALFRLAGIDLGPVNLVQIALSLGICWFVWRWADALWGRAAGRWALALAVVYPTLITHPASFLYTETLYTFLAALALHLLSGIGWADRRAAPDRPPPPAGPVTDAWPPLTRRALALALLSGAAIGLAALTRSAGLTLLGVALVWGALAGWRAPRRAAALLALVTLGAALTIAPWTARNYRVYGGFLLLDTIGAYNLWRENPLPGEDPPAVLARLPTPVEQQRVALTRGLASLRARPDRALARLPANLLGLGRLELDAYARGGGYAEDLTDRSAAFPWALAADAAHLAVGALALLALALAPWRRGRTAGQARFQLLLLLWIVANLVPVLLVHPEARYRIPYQPQLLVFAALPLVAGRGLVARARAAPWRAAVAAALLLLLLAGAWSPRLAPVLHMQAWVTAGDLLDRWRPVAAETAYERAVAAFPASDRPLVILGDARRRAGDTAGAIDAYTAALAIQPYNLAAALPLMDLERLTGQPDDARRVLRATDTSDATLLAWAWRRHTPPPTAAVDVGSGFEFGSLINFYAPEGQAPTDFRWTNGHGLVRLTVPPGGAARLTIRLSGMRPRGAPPAGGVDILVDGRALGAVAADGAWRTAALDLGALDLAPGSTVLVEVRSAAVVPAAPPRGGGDASPVGVAVDRIGLDS